MNNRSDCVLIQQASGEYRDLLAMTVKPHLEYCLRHDIDYWPIFGEARSRYTCHPPHYDRVFLMQKAIDAGYEKVIWMDADCILNWQGEEDLRDGVPEAGIGALWCALEWTEPRHYDHWCTGALYVPANDRNRHFLHDWGMKDYDKHGWVDQHAFNLLTNPNLEFPQYPHTVQPLDRHWHAIVPHFLTLEDAPPPMVIAFHGYGDLQARAACMHAFLHGEEGAQ